jgi:hypothetical protein
MADGRLKKSVKKFQTKEIDDETNIFQYLHNMGGYLNQTIFKKELGCPLDKFVLSIDKLRTGRRVRTLGTYRSKSGIGFSNLITLNIVLINNKTMMAAVLFHEMVHEYQDLYDPRPTRTRPYHDVRFRQVSEPYAPTNSRGHFMGITEEFVAIITASGLVEHVERRLIIGSAALEELLLNPKPGKRQAQPTKMKKWSCGCTNVRCAVGLNAICGKCGEKFTLQDETT